MKTKVVTTEDTVNVINIIGVSTEIKGDVTTKGDIRINGRLVGSLRIEGKLIVGDTGYIEGEIYCTNAEIAGKIKGKMVTKELSSFTSTAKFDGELTTGKLIIEEGATLDGTCKMTKNQTSQSKPAQENK